MLHGFVFVMLSDTTHRGAWWPRGRVSDSESRGHGVNLHWGLQVVSLSKTHQLPKVLVDTQEAVVPHVST